MNIVILSRKPGLYLNRKIEQIAKSSDIKVSIIDPLSCDLVLDGKSSKVLYDGKPLENVDFVIPRMGTTVLDYGLSVLRQFELMGTPVLNSSVAINNSLKRYEYLQLLSSNPDIKTPLSVLIRKSKQIKDAINKVNGPPAMLKVMSNTSKLGAMMIENVATAESYLDVNSIMGGMGQVGQSIIIEEFISETNGKSIYVLVLNGEVLGANYKIKAFNVKQSTGLLNKPAQGFVNPGKEICETAIRAAEQLKLDFVKIGILESLDGPKVYEVSFNPQVEVFDKHPDAHVAAKIVAHASSCAKESAISGVD